MNKFVRPALYSLFGVAVLGVGAAYLFSGGSDPAPEANNPPAPTPVTETPAATDESTAEHDQPFGDAIQGVDAPLDLNAKTSDVIAASEAAPPAPVALPTGPRVVLYKVKPGEVLSRIANRFGCKVEDIYRLNNGIDAKNAHKVQAGRKIQVLNVKNVTDGIEEIAPKAPSTETVSNNGTGSASPVVDINADPTRPANAGNAPAANIEPLPETPVVEKKPEPAAPDWSTARKHTLKHGDNYFDLANKYYGAISFWRHIRDANPQWKPMDTQPGMEIVIPALKGEEVSKPALPKVATASDSIIPPRK